MLLAMRAAVVGLVLVGIAVDLPLATALRPLQERVASAEAAASAGSWGDDGLLKNEGKERYGVLYRQWQKNVANFSIDGHYPVQELWDRAQSCWERILAHEGKSVLVVAHNAVNQALVATSLGLGAKYFRILLQSNCGASVLDFTPQAGGGPPNVRLNRLNQVIDEEV